MLAASGSEPHSDDHIFANTNAERRATDRIVRLWKNASDKQTIIAGIDRSLWEHCFLLVLDDLIDCSIIFDHGDSAARGLHLPDAEVLSLKDLPQSLGDRIFSLGLKCMQTRSPCCDEQDLCDAQEKPVSRYRLALVPLLPANERHDRSSYPVMSVLGVFTYQ
jgi:hypothetical protein